MADRLSVAANRYSNVSNYRLGTLSPSCFVLMVFDRARHKKKQCAALLLRIIKTNHGIYYSFFYSLMILKLELRSPEVTVIK